MVATSKKPKLDFDSKVRAQGYVTVREVSERTGKDPSTIYRWIEEGSVQGLEVLGKHYVLFRSLINHVGLEASVIIGLITRDQMQSFKKGE